MESQQLQRIGKCHRNSFWFWTT